jgi:hypothetical protein
MNNLKQMVLAMHSYANDHDHRLPSAAICATDGKPLLSWRVLLLPYLEEENLFKEFKLDEPWDGPHNRELLRFMPSVYATPAQADIATEQFTTYCQVFVGPGTAFEKNKTGQGWLLPKDFPDGTSNTIFIAQSGTAVPWTQPADLVYDPAKPLPALGGVFTGEARFGYLGSRRSRLIFVALGDGSVRSLPADLSDATFRLAIVRNDGKLPGPDWN